MKAVANSYDIARAARVSRTVVSLVINGRADRYQIARATQERVRSAINQYGYTPNMTLRNMFLKRREMVKAGGGTADPGQMKAAVEPGLKAAGFQVKTVTISTDPATALAQITAALKSGMVTVIAPAVDADDRGQNTEDRQDQTPPIDRQQAEQTIDRRP